MEFVRLSTPYIALTAARVCRLWTGTASPSITEEILQEVFFKLCEQDRKILREFEPRGQDSFYALLRTVSASVANDHFRRQNSVKRGGRTVTDSLEDQLEQLPAPSCSQQLHQTILQKELDEMMRSAPEVISERDRSLYWLYYLHGFTAEELASMDRTQLTASGVESALRRITNWLKKEMQTRKRTP